MDDFIHQVPQPYHKVCTFCHLRSKFQHVQYYLTLLMNMDDLHTATPVEFYALYKCNTDQYLSNHPMFVISSNKFMMNSWHTEILLNITPLC